MNVAKFSIRPTRFKKWASCASIFLMLMVTMALVSFFGRFGSPQHNTNETKKEDFDSFDAADRTAMRLSKEQYDAKRNVNIEKDKKTEKDDENKSFKNSETSEMIRKLKHVVESNYHKYETMLRESVDWIESELFTDVNEYLKICELNITLTDKNTISKKEGEMMASFDVIDVLNSYVIEKIQTHRQIYREYSHHISKIIFYDILETYENYRCCCKNERIKKTKCGNPKKSEPYQGPDEIKDDPNPSCIISEYDQLKDEQRDLSNKRLDRLNSSKNHRNWESLDFVPHMYDEEAKSYLNVNASLVEWTDNRFKTNGSLDSEKLSCKVSFIMKRP